MNCNPIEISGWITETMSCVQSGYRSLRNLVNITCLITGKIDLMLGT
jgi:hypothetical protein